MRWALLGVLAAACGSDDPGPVCLGTTPDATHVVDLGCAADFQALKTFITLLAGVGKLETGPTVAKPKQAAALATATGADPTPMTATSSTPAATILVLQVDGR